MDALPYLLPLLNKEVTAPLFQIARDIPSFFLDSHVQAWIAILRRSSHSQCMCVYALMSVILNKIHVVSLYWVSISLHVNAEAWLKFMSCWSAWLKFMSCWLAWLNFMSCWSAWLKFMSNTPCTDLIGDRDQLIASEVTQIFDHLQMTLLARHEEARSADLFACTYLYCEYIFIFVYCAYMYVCIQIYTYVYRCRRSWYLPNHDDPYTTYYTYMCYIYVYRDIHMYIDIDTYTCTSLNVLQSYIMCILCTHVLFTYIHRYLHIYTLSKSQHSQ